MNAKTKSRAKTKVASGKAKKSEASPKKLSALDAAANVLAETGEPMRCQELIKDMAAKGYWTSPKGLTPHATLYAAMHNEIAKKGASARFKKTERGMFSSTGVA
jgi:hypothetical protein